MPVLHFTIIFNALTTRYFRDLKEPLEAHTCASCMLLVVAVPYLPNSNGFK